MTFRTTCATSVAVFTALATLLGQGSFTSTAHADVSKLGVMADVGVPDGATASVVFRPFSMLSVHGGLGYNLIAPGVRAGVSFRPIPWLISPSLSVEAGRFFRGDANKTAEMFGAGSDDDEGSPILKDVGYDFANFHLGVELGHERVSFYLHAGFSGIRGDVRNLQEQLDSDSDMAEDDGPTVEIRKDPVVNLWIPSARTGLIFFF